MSRVKLLVAQVSSKGTPVAGGANPTRFCTMPASMTFGHPFQAGVCLWNNGTMSSLGRTSDLRDNKDSPPFRIATHQEDRVC